MKKLCMPSVEDHLINALECYHRAISTYEKMAEFNKGEETQDFVELVWECASKSSSID